MSNLPAVRSPKPETSTEVRQPFQVAALRDLLGPMVELVPLLNGGVMLGQLEHGGRVILLRRRNVEAFHNFVAQLAMRPNVHQILQN